MLLICLIFLFPLLNFVLQLSVGKKMPFANYIAVANIGIAFVCSMLLCYDTWASDKVIAGTWEWLSFSQPFLKGKMLTFSLDLYVDKLAALMILLVTGIATLVHIFSLEYMRKEAYLHRYWGYLGLFCAAMLGILVAGNLLLMFVCWELVGVSSYFLIGFWFTKEAPAKASEKAFLMNRIGDVGFLAGILLLYTTFGTINLHELNAIFATASHSSDDIWQFSTPFAPLFTVHCSLLTVIGILLFCGCIGKSAQFPLQSWLPDAMEGPTPVSALIHAATMVAAGVYLTARIYALLTIDALQVIAIIGAVTAFISALSAISQTDIKRVLAYSTISQLGYMVMAMGVHGYGFSLFHLLTHAFFKCGLFLIAAIIIHEIVHQIEGSSSFSTISAQDMRYMGGLRKSMPKTFYAYLGCMLSLSGVPLFSGFLSKEGILIKTAQWAINQSNTLSLIVPILAFGTVGITAFYMTRHALLIFGGENRLTQSSVIRYQLSGRNKALGRLKQFLFSHVRHQNTSTLPASHAGSVNFHDAKALMLIPVSILAVFSIFIWFSFSPFSAENSWFILKVLPPKNSFLPHETNGHTSHLLVSLVSLSLMASGAFIAYFLWKKSHKKLIFSPLPIFSFPLSTLHIQLSTFLATFDKQIVDGIVNLVASLVVNPHPNVAQFDKKFIDGFFEAIANFFINPHRGSISLSWFAAKFDYHIIDGIVNTIGKGTQKVGEKVRTTQTGSLQTYILFALIGILLLGGSAWLMLRGKQPAKPQNSSLTVSDRLLYAAVQTVIRQDSMMTDFAETGYFSPILINESEILATDSSEFSRINEALGDSFAFAKTDFSFFQSQFKARPDSFLMSSDSFSQQHISTFNALAIALGDSASNDSSIWELFHEAKGSELHFYQISLPIFSQNLQQCLLSVKMQCGHHCGKGHKLLLRKEKEAWKVVKVFQKWSS